MTAATARRPVRVTIDGEAYSPADGVLIVVRKDGGKIVFPAKTEGVTVQDTPAVRTWTDGDVVQNSRYGWTLTRTDRMWLLSNGREAWEDGDVTESLTDPADPYYGELVVLRYQHGGDQ